MRERFFSGTMPGMSGSAPLNALRRTDAVCNLRIIMRSVLASCSFKTYEGVMARPQRIEYPGALFPVTARRLDGDRYIRCPRHEPGSRMNSVMRRIGTIVLLVSILIPPAAFGKSVVVRYELDSAEYAFTFDSENIPEGLFLKYIAWHPSSLSHGSNTVIMLELCHDDPKYSKPCGKRTLGDKNFLLNAKVNLEEGKKNLAALGALDQIKDLQPMIDYCKEELRFSIWINQALYDFYSTWDIDCLKRKYKGIDPSILARDHLADIAAAKTAAEKYELAKYGWHNQINRRFRSDLGAWPQASWEQFIKDYKIEVKVLSDPGE